MKKLKFDSAPEWVTIIGEFGPNCILLFGEKALSKGSNKKLALNINKLSPTNNISSIEIAIEDMEGRINIWFGDINNKINFNTGTKGNYNITMYKNSALLIGENTTANSIRIVCDNSIVETGRDCMFSDEILIQSADQHGIVDLETKQIINSHKRKVVLGDHIWVGRRAIIMPDVNIGDGSIIGTGAIVTKNVEKMTAAAGIPAKTVKENVTWSRSPSRLDSFSQLYIDKFHEPLAEEKN
ncbi:MAG: acyltransferase [Bacteroidota bacterium]